MVIMTIRCGSKVLMRAVEMKQVINKQWPYVLEKSKKNFVRNGPKLNNRPGNYSSIYCI